MSPINYQKKNIETIEGWISQGWKWGLPLSREQCLAIKKGAWIFDLTPTKITPRDWFPKDLKGLKVLGLASGGGQQMPVLSMLGAKCTVFDYSQRQLDSERLVAEREGYTIELVQGDFTKPLPFADESFDIVVNPVSLVYAEKEAPILLEVARVLKKGGLFVGGFDNGINFITDDKEEEIKESFPFNPLTNHQQREESLASDSGYEFSHTIGETLIALLKAGFHIDDVYEDTNGEGRLEELHIPTFLAIKAHKEE